MCHTLFQSIKPRLPSLIEVDCRWPVSSLYDQQNKEEDQYIASGRGSRKSVNSNRSNSMFAHSFGRGRQMNFISPISGFSM